MAGSRSRSRSRSPRSDSRRRSRSPDRRRDSRPKNSGGFRWKDKRPRDDRYRDGDRRLERGYRDQGRPRSPDRYRGSGKYDEVDRHDERDRRRMRDEPSSDKAPKDKDEDKDDRKAKKPKEKKTPVPQSTEEMIIVHVNDRLGTKAAIPCLASDPIKLFKAQVAARIGREPHEILLKRQGERPFKDQLTLQDYGVSNGVQIDFASIHPSIHPTVDRTLRMLHKLTIPAGRLTQAIRPV
ncbi:ubiquitin-related domain-containing protein [Talaromyces proteolyticus]|uniref:Ubiquitin-like modifier HUB1 n=1 Tax=Talaromyces proteolyticus TaxID=1131652 RepID=A0AAD4PZ91_9EURO|nr:ubiquitin-related domain-containing protein [Talaromyces proteolyticus]KAH8695429.1 ubiquitin-related domain-containing protein [Talaromyces proteolyticus]